ncbi:MAG: TonB-dependent receptor [Desulfobacterales bacterium]|nr:TonB-dependent receptor [Desulfobacterales bacterium]
MMRCKAKWLILTGIFCLLSGYTQLLSAEETMSSLEDEFRFQKAETYVITAARVLENIRKSAASISVVTEKQIQQMGARDLIDVLNTVPGIHCQDSNQGQIHINVRGVRKSSSPHVMMMINSHPIFNNFLGSATWTYDNMHVDNIKQIEVIRGPGSALYGANAFAAIINIITKMPEDIENTCISTGYGSFDTQKINLLTGQTFGQTGIALNLNYFHTDGYRELIEEDYQTQIDKQFGLNASLAPGYTKGNDERYDVQFSLKHANFHLDSRYIDRHKDVRVGIIPVLNEKSQDPSEDYYINLGYDEKITSTIDVSGKVYINHMHMHSSYELIPKGGMVLTLEPDGIKPIILDQTLIGMPTTKNRRIGAEIQTNFRISNSNTLVTGLIYEEAKQYDVHSMANFIATGISNVFIPLENTIDLTNIADFNKNANRTFKAIFMQDMQDIGDQLSLSIGARLDAYSDFGNSFNPRAGITYRFSELYDLKLLYGHAFRAPSFNDLYTSNNPAYVGNPNLKPEEIDTYEISFGATPVRFIESRFTLFNNRIKNDIDTEYQQGQYVFKNMSRFQTRGIESEITYNFGRGSSLSFNHTYMENKNLSTGERVHKAPKNIGIIMSNFRINKYVNWYSSFRYEKGMKRQKEDNRPNIPNYEEINTSLMVKNLIKALEIKASVYNILNKNLVLPADKGNLPNDLPQSGRSAIVEVAYEF